MSKPMRKAAAEPAKPSVACAASLSNAALGALDTQLAAFGKSKSTLFNFRVRQARALLRPLASAFYEERSALLVENVKAKEDGTLDIEDKGNGLVRFGFKEGQAAAGMKALTELMAVPVELPSGLPLFTVAMFDAAGISATEAELEALGPLLDMQSA